MLNSLFFLLAFSTPCDVSGQLYFQLENAFTTDVKRYSIGDALQYRTKEFEENWLTDKIVRILPQDDALVFYDKIIYLDEITHVRYNQPWANGLGTSLMGFGIGWLSYGGAIEGLRGIGAIETQYEFGWDTAIIGASSLVSGYLIKNSWKGCKENEQEQSGKNS